MRLSLQTSLNWLKSHRQLVILVLGLSLLAILQAIQVFYPNDRLLPFTSIDDQSVGGQTKLATASRLDDIYNKQKINVQLGELNKSALTPTFADIGATTTNQQRLEQINYPWYLRLVPTSILWANRVIDDGEARMTRSTQKMTSYLETTAKDSCQVDPVSATLKVSGDELKLVESTDGLRCDLSDLREGLKAASPDITQDTVSVKVAAEAIKPMVDNDEAAALARVIEQNVSDGVKINVAGTLLTITQADILSWLDFVVTQDGRLDVVVNQERSADFTGQQLSPRVAIAPGVSYITTRDFEEIERKNGPDGRSLNIAATLDQIKYVLVGKLQTATAVVVAVPPRIEYTRTYSSTDAGMNALLANFAKDNSGTFGVSYAELSGDRRRAEYQADKKFVTASTYKLYVAYSTLLRVEAGKFSWSEPITGGRNLETCFNDMISKSDNPCAETLLRKIGFRELTDDASKIGLKNTTFLEGDRPLTSAGDLAVFLATLESGQMLTPASRAKLLDAMKGNVFRQGIPAGANGQVADKVGFLDNFLHDAAVVYSPNGTYVLSVMSEDSSWAKIAELTRAIEKLRAS